jgi:hypothetical protein
MGGRITWHLQRSTDSDRFLIVQREPRTSLAATQGEEADKDYWKELHS